MRKSCAAGRVQSGTPVKRERRKINTCEKLVRDGRGLMWIDRLRIQTNEVHTIRGRDVKNDSNITCMSVVTSVFEIQVQRSTGS